MGVAGTGPNSPEWKPPHRPEHCRTFGDLRVPFHLNLADFPHQASRRSGAQEASRDRSGSKPNLDGRQDLRGLGEPATRSGRRLSDTSGKSARIDVEQAWVSHYAANTLPSRDYVNAMAVDSAGNVYVTGYSEITLSSGDYLTIKYDSFGDTLWTRRYNGRGNSYDEPTSVAVDSHGNVVVTGYSYNLRGESDYLTLKYDPTGAELWAMVYAGAEESTDVATGLAIDAQGDVFVTGYSYTSQGDFDFLTIKYSADGTLEWSRKFDGDIHGVDIPTAIAAGASGAISITGYVQGATDGFDFGTVSYRPEGTEAWHASYNGTSNADDRATAVAIDPAGNTLITGFSFAGGQDYNYITIKYDSIGSQTWAIPYDGAAHGDDRSTALALDCHGNIFVTGLSSGSAGLFNCTTMKYDPQGSELWRRQFAAAANTNSIPTSVAVDGSGNVVIAGYVDNILSATSNLLALEYDSSGVRLWATPLSNHPNQNNMGIEAGVDAAGNVYVAGTDAGSSGAQDFMTVRYDAPRFPFWPVRFDATGNGSEKLTAMAQDASGNVYVTGFGYRDLGTGYSVITAKFDPDGRQKWVAVIDSTTADFYTPQLFIDSRMNVYVAALSYYTSAYRSSFVTVKYDSNGVRQWMVVESSLQQSEIKGIVADENGGVYVAGTNFYERHMVLVKYDGSGQKEWMSFQNGRCGALGIDSTGAVYLTGSADGFVTRADVITVKYDANGDTLWTVFYNAPNNGIDGATAISIDVTGNVYVAGSTYSAESGYLFVTLKYNALGIQQWAEIFPDSGRSYSYPSAIVASRDGRVFVTGRALSVNYYLTIAYDSNGVGLWNAFYDGPGPGIDLPSSIAVAPSGDVYVTGSSPGVTMDEDFATIKYGRSGILQWVARYQSPRQGRDFAQAVLCDPRGFVYVAGTSGGDYLIERYDTTGAGFVEPDAHWPSRYNGAGLSNDYAASVRVDSSGRVVISGGTAKPSGYLNYLTAEYNAAGGSATVNTWAGYGFDADAVALAIDREGNRYVTGDVARQYGSFDMATLKYDASGVRKWVALYNGIADDYDFAAANAVDDSGNVYVTGYSVGRGSGYDFVTLKYWTDGTLQWEARYNGPGNDNDLALAMNVDGAGNVYVTGLSAGPGSQNDIATVKYDRSGNQQWAVRYNGPANSDDRPAAIASDDSGNVYVTGSSKGISGFYDYITIKYDSSGQVKWSVTYDGPGHTDDFARSLGIDRAGSIVVTGSSNGGAATRADFGTIRYDHDGRPLWIERYDGPGNGDDVPRSLAIDSAGNVYVTGKSVGADHTYDFETLKYTATGILEWQTRYSAADNVDDVPSALTIDGHGNLYVTGNSTGASWSIISTVKYTQTVVSTPDPGAGTPLTYKLYDNFPNPFNPSTNIAFDLPTASRVSLKIFDLLGRELATLAVDELFSKGHHSLQCTLGELSTGVYFYRLVAAPVTGTGNIDRRSSFENTRKMIYVK